LNKSKTEERVVCQPASKQTNKQNVPEEEREWKRIDV
jgi:hypothetical protein